MIKIIKSVVEKKFLIEHYKCKYGRFSKIIAKLNRNKLFVPCLEVPITTHCTLCCKECSNLIQFYSMPYHVPIDTLVESIESICGVVNGIDCIRILGGEPFLHPDIDLLLTEIKKQHNVKNIVIVTNGTVLLHNSTLGLLAEDQRVRVSISIYPCAIENRTQLIKQLNDYGINYVERNVVWKAKANAKFCNKNDFELRQSFLNCPNRFFSLLNGKLFLCPRASHGTDLGIISSGKDEFVNCIDNNKLKEEILQLLSRSFLTACNYCSEDISDTLPVVPAGVQIKRSDAEKIFQEILNNNN